MHIDCHSHLSFLSEAQLGPILKAANKSWILGGYNPEDWSKQKELKEKHSNSIMTCFGLHPWFVLNKDFEKEKNIKLFTKNYQEADWVGEVGLDFFKGKSAEEKKIQKDVFVDQLIIAKEKPFVFHIVQAHGQALEILKNRNVKGFIHSFSGSYEVAKLYFDQGIRLSFGPNLLKGHFKKTREALLRLPMEAILIESDTPNGPTDQSNPNEMYIKVLEEVAYIKKIDKKDLAIQVSKNIKSLLKSPEESLSIKEKH